MPAAFQQWLNTLSELSQPWHEQLWVLGWIAMAGISLIITRRYLALILHKFLSFSARPWDELLSTHRVFRRLSHLVPGIMLVSGLPPHLEAWPLVQHLATKLSWIYLIISLALAVAGLVNAIIDYGQRHSRYRNVPLMGMGQIIKLGILLITLISIAALVLDKSPALLLSGLGALTAVILLVFRDVILGLVASIQIAVNRLVRHGDWVEIPKYGADGEVLEVGLTTVRVKNWDNTITTVPTYSLISDAFKNWRPMQSSGGRRVKRALRLDINSIRQLNIDEVQNLNAELGLQLQEDTTNSQAFRQYLKTYLQQHTQVNQGMTLIVRHLPPDSQGLPLELYFFIRDTRWTQFESIQSDIFDHLFALVSKFDLRIFQFASAHDRIQDKQNAG